MLHLRARANRPWIRPGNLVPRRGRRETPIIPAGVFSCLRQTENQLRAGLPAGGKEIRTLGPRQRGYAFFETPPSNSAIPLRRAKPVPSGQEPPVPFRHAD